MKHIAAGLVIFVMATSSTFAEEAQNPSEKLRLVDVAKNNIIGFHATYYQNLTWTEVRWILDVTRVRKIDDFFQAVARKESEEKSRKYFADPERLKDFRTIEQVLDQNLRNDPKLATKEATLTALTQEKGFRWLTKEHDHATLQREYSLTVHQSTSVQYMINWGNSVFVDIYTDNDGRIVAYSSTR